MQISWISALPLSSCGALSSGRGGGLQGGRYKQYQMGDGRHLGKTETPYSRGGCPARYAAFEQRNEKVKRIAMSMTSLCFASMTAGFIAWVSAPALAQSIDQSFYYKPPTEFRGTQMNL